MADQSATDPLELFQLSKDFIAAQQKFLPSGQLYARTAEAMRNIAQANITYIKELMRANATLLAAFTERPGPVKEERPSSAAHHPASSEHG